MLLLAGCPSRSERVEPSAPPSAGSAAKEVGQSPRRGAAANETGQTPQTQATATTPADERAAERERLFDAVAREYELSPRVLGAMKRVQRHRFVPEDIRREAYADRPLPIGHGQTISQPAVVAAMTELAAPKPTDKCLEIGTGSGYQAAVLAELCAKVYSIEYLAPLAKFAEQNLRGSGYGAERVALRTGDGYRGWPEAAPFQVIVVTAAPERVPQPLKDQLAEGGRLVIPVGPQSGHQELELWRRLRPGNDDGAFDVKQVMGVRFVPFLGEGR